MAVVQSEHVYTEIDQAVAAVRGDIGGTYGASEITSLGGTETFPAFLAGSPKFISYTNLLNDIVADSILTNAFQAKDAGLTSISGLTTAADKMIYTTALDTYAVADLSAFARTLLDDADASTARGTLGLVIGTDVQAYDADLTTWAGLTPSANAQSLVTAANYAAMRTLLDVESGVDFDPVGTDNSTDVTLAGTPDYITLVGQVLTRNAVDLSTDVTGALATGTVPWSQLTSVPSTFAPSAHNHATSEITSGTFADARIAASNVTQHQASITIASSQISDKGSASGVASLDGTGKIPSSQLPALAITSVYTAASEIAQLALTTQEGDVAVRTDENKSYIHNGGVAGTMADWQLLNTPTDTVLSVNGYTGSVTLSKSDVSLGSVENTALSTWAGTSSINTVGTVGTGTWQGGVVQPTYGGTGLTSISTLLNSNVTPTTLGLVIGTDVQAYDATYLVDADIGVNVQAYDAGLQAFADLADGSGILSNNGSGVFSWTAAGGSGDALVANPLSQFAATTSLQLLGVISDETGTGSLVFATAPTFASIADTGVVSAGTWQGGVVQPTYGGTGLTSISTLLNSNVTPTTLGLVIGTDVQAYDATYLVDADIGVTVQAYDADLTTWASLTPSLNAQSLVTAADYAAMRTLLDLEVGVDFDAAGTDNSTNVSLAAGLDYLSLAGQVLTLGSIDLTTDVTGVLPSGNIGAHNQSASTITAGTFPSGAYVFQECDR
jgi:hypothetical protein